MVLQEPRQVVYINDARPVLVDRSKASHGREIKAQSKFILQSSHLALQFDFALYDGRYSLLNLERHELVDGDTVARPVEGCLPKIVVLARQQHEAEVLLAELGIIIAVEEQNELH